MGRDTLSCSLYLSSSFLTYLEPGKLGERGSSSFSFLQNFCPTRNTQYGEGAPHPEFSLTHFILSRCWPTAVATTLFEAGMCQLSLEKMFLGFSFGLTSSGTLQPCLSLKPLAVPPANQTGLPELPFLLYHLVRCGQQ